jgi:putative two-component system response regulator
VSQKERNSRAGYFEDLLDVGIALSSIHNLENLLDYILQEARRLTGADAGTLYLAKNGRLLFKVSQCQSLATRFGEERMRQMYQSFEMPISSESVAGYAALTRKVLNLPDVKKIPGDAPYRYNPTWDRKAGYSTQSMMVVPMLNREDRVIGILQLINSLKGGQVGPFETHYEKLASSLASQAAVAIENAELTEELKEAHLDTIFRLAVAAEYRDKETANHIRRMSHFSARIAESLGWSKDGTERMLWSSLMHDVGKLGIPDHILQKPGRLTPEERKIMEYHTVIGGEILRGSQAPVLKQSRTIALTHHEKFDGTGYPRGLKGDRIPMEGRITILADVFDALSSKRVYKRAMEEREVLRILEEGRGFIFDPMLVDIFYHDMNAIREIQDRYGDREEDYDKFKNLEKLGDEDEEVPSES